MQKWNNTGVNRPVDLVFARTKPVFGALVVVHKCPWKATELRARSCVQARAANRITTTSGPFQTRNNQFLETVPSLNVVWNNYSSFTDYLELAPFLWISSRAKLSYTINILVIRMLYLCDSCICIFRPQLTPPEMKICQVRTMLRLNCSDTLQNNLQNLTTEREALQQRAAIVMRMILLLVNFGYS